MVACPCCGYNSIISRACFEICSICFWEDDGQDNENADVVLGGPNSDVSLTQARMNFIEHGIFDPRRADLRPMQDKTDDYTQVRTFVFDLATGVMTELDKS